LIERLPEAAGLDRAVVRRDADTRFSAARMLEDYERAYRRLAHG
jgi:hypothetical protein